MFDGKQIRDEILKDLADKIVLMEEKPTMAELLIGEDPVSTKYVQLKKKLAENTGIQFSLYQFKADDSEEEIIECIKFLNCDPETKGILIQMPVPKKFDKKKLVSAINAKKDIDGLRYCENLDSDFRPPVVLAILEALGRSQSPSTAVIPAEAGIHETIFGSQIKSGMTTKKIVVVGKGFLVGDPLVRTLNEEGIKPAVISNDSKRSREISRQPNLDIGSARNDKIKEADVIISATGKPGIIKPDMVKEGVVLIDAGTAEENGELKGDIDPETYKKASYYTPVPGGIGPVTVAMLFRNLLNSK